MVIHALGESTRRRSDTLVPSLAPGALRSQLMHLRENFDLVPASRLSRAIRERMPGDRLPAAITFDDDLFSHAALAAPLLKEMGVPATFFLCGSSLDRPRTYWWQRLELAIGRDLPVGAVLRRHGFAARSAEASLPNLGRAIEMLQAADRDALSTELGDLLGEEPPDAGLRRHQVRQLADEGFEIGFHTARHDYLPHLDDGDLAASLAEGRAQLQEVTGQPLDLIAYPHGAADERVMQAASDAGFRAGFTLMPSAAGAKTAELLVGRIESFESRRGVFALELALMLRRYVRGLRPER